MITSLIMYWKALLLHTLIIFPLFGFGQTTLDSYLQQGLESNIVLKQKNIELNKALYALKTANSLFLPSITLHADYTHGKGGRTIDFPLGDLLNPAYTALNQLTETNNFPQLENQEFYFFPQNFYDAKLRTSIPVFNPELVYNRKIQEKQYQLKEHEIEAYRLELIRDIKIAYFNYLSSISAITIYSNALEIAIEGKRINESLLKNGKGIKAFVLRSESEIQNLKSQKTEAEEKADNARQYFNFLLNRELSEPIVTDSNTTINLDETELLLKEQILIDNRPELKMMDKAEAINEKIIRMNRSFWYPRLNAFTDLGSQGFDWRYNNKTRYYLVGAQLQVPLFAAGRNLYRIKQSRLEMEHLLIQNELNRNQISLAANTSRNKLKVAIENYKSSLKQLEAATSYYDLINTGYREGMNTYLEILDARSELTNASLNHNIQLYQLLAAKAAFERETAKNNQ